MKNRLDPSKVRISTKRISVDSILRKIENNEIDMAWATECCNRSQVIESILTGIPIPSFYVDGTRDKWVITHGFQVIKTLKAFILDLEFTLAHLEYFPELNNKGWTSLPRSHQRKIEETEIAVHIIEPGTPLYIKDDILQRINDLT